ncbi:metallophosphoesterase [Segetibacter koreensis]|uniref:metallophosphoesterase n=1 Tax=Segetibacter koreensis TaxID=398037 RepID=UPI000364972A|nr:metallophosphoesterase [Segetibacter koreensis]
MRKFLQRILSGPVSRLADKYSSKPDKARVHKALTQLYNKISTGNEKKGLLIDFTPDEDRFIIFSDQHKGAKNGSDDFAFAEKNYLYALEYYNQNNFHFISLGDGEELWENTLAAVKKCNVASYEKEKSFLQRNAFSKVFGNHDLEWDNSPLAGVELRSIYGCKVPIYEGIILKTPGNNPLRIFLTHGHQGDELSDGNWFSKWFVAKIWAPLQSYLSINPNTPAFQDHLKTDHNLFMYEWITKQKNMLLITGHTHQPVFQSLTHLESLYRNMAAAKEANDVATIQLIESEIEQKKLKGNSLPDFTAYKPTYFNSGCCCFNDGDITGIEIADGKIRLIKWEYGKDKLQLPSRVVLDETDLEPLGKY